MTHKREPSKCREWEKIRRDKLNTGFSCLSKLLPNHDPSLTWSKLYILQRASQYIEELQVKLKNVLTAEGITKTRRNELVQLYGRVKKMLVRNEQLCNLLKDAGIKIPSEYGNVKHFRNPLQWANKITTEQAKKFEKEEMQKENKDTNKAKKTKRNLKRTAIAIKHRKKDSKKLKLMPANKPAVISLQLSNVLPISVTQSLPKVPNQSCFIITNKPPINLSTSLQQNFKTSKAATVVTNSSSLAAPKMASTVKLSTATSKVTTTTLNTLGPGTLILANGNIVPILQPPTVLPTPTLLANPPSILLKPPTNNTTLIVMPSNTSQGQICKSAASTSNVTIHPKIRPKVSITCTTQVNKVPIPAIASKYNNSTAKIKSSENRIQRSKKVKLKPIITLQNKKLKSNTPVQTENLIEKSETKSNANLSVDKEIVKIVENTDATENSKSKQVPLEIPEEVITITAEDSKIKSPLQNKPVEESETLAPSNTTTDEVTSCVNKTNELVSSEPQIDSSTEKTLIKETEKPKENKKIDIPITTAVNSTITTSTELGVNLNHSELSNDLFSTLQVPIGSQNPESTSPTAAFLLAFPLVSSLTGVKVTEVIEEDNSDSRHGTPTLLQIGTMDTTKTTQSLNVESLTPNLLNLDNFSFFSGNNFYSSFDNTNCPITDGTKTASACAKITEQTSAKEPVKVSETTTPLIINTNPSLYTSEQQVTSKPNLVNSNSFSHLNTSISYSKPPSSTLVTSTYTHVSMPQINCTTTHKPAESQYSTVSIPQCNAFNPFSDFSKANSYATFPKTYSDPLYTNSNYAYSHHNENNFNQNLYYPTKPAKPINNAYNTSNYPDTPAYNVIDNRKRHALYYNQSRPQAKHSTSKSTKTTSQPKPPINWMTTPDFRTQPSGSDYLVPPIEYTPNTFYSSNSFASTTHTTYFNTTSSMYPSNEFQNSISDNRKTFDSNLPILPSNSTQRNEFEENQFSWSPTKLPQFLEAPHTFVSSTLPTLVGDLALGTQPSFVEQKLEPGKSKESNRRPKGHSVTYDNQSNFLSVSQLVENKPEPSSARTTNRRNSGNRSVKSSSQKTKNSHKQNENKEIMESTTQVVGIEKKHNINYNTQNIGNSSWITECNKPNRHGHKNPQSSYSAEALIGHQENSDNSVAKQRYRQQSNYTSTNKTLPIPTFLSDNIVPYFPPVEISQDNNFMQTNSNYQSFGTSVQNNSYSTSGPTITSNYLQPSSLIPEYQNYSSIIPEPEKIDSKHCNRTEAIKQTGNGPEAEERANMLQIHSDCSATTNNFSKKSKNKQSNESNLPGIVDFGFLSMPNAINSPILPDDFHTHSNFLPPPTPSQLYPCKNPLYAKQTSELLPLPPPVPVTRNATQNFEATPAAVTSNAGSLTSFNLSAIFPEINKGSMPLAGLYADPSRNKNYNFQRNYIGSSAQVFHNKSSSSVTYANSLPTSYAPSN